MKRIADASSFATLALNKQKHETGGILSGYIGGKLQQLKDMKIELIKFEGLNPLLKAKESAENVKKIKKTLEEEQDQINKDIKELKQTKEAAKYIPKGKKMRPETVYIMAQG